MNCPICGKQCDAQGVSNHMRLTDGDGHGPCGQMPDDHQDAEQDDRGDRGAANGGEVMVRDPVSQNEVPVDEALQMLFDQLYGEVNALSRRIDRLDDDQEQLAAIEDRLDRVERAVSVANNICPQCHGRMYETGGLLSESRKKCEQCGHSPTRAMSG